VVPALVEGLEDVAKMLLLQAVEVRADGVELMNLVLLVVWRTAMLTPGTQRGGPTGKP